MHRNQAQRAAGACGVGRDVRSSTGCALRGQWKPRISAALRKPTQDPATGITVTCVVERQIPAELQLRST